ncbi:hypothetical protein FZEAL_9070 [Fusarium zealandicum]|uniref:Heterokaryon incompatibility domain-containing protein n=1 Tax=Fusarium zealandicum TaxID=1053134 RepID=A0A8H4UD72_9HYPO|nr:hypothetical protein FZEAL_9070 [Fusarium zealandicum]
MEEWHDPGCRRPDLMSVGDLTSCLNCGAFCLQTEQGATASLPAKDVKYVYEPLLSEMDIRLITISPGADDDPIQCRLFLTSLSTTPQYYAISYTWAGELGGQDRDSSILLDGVKFPVTSNCVAALKRVRRRVISKPLWVDAICINQEMDLEKNHQVRNMPQIYARAKCVLIYVGEPTPEENELLAFLESGKVPVPGQPAFGEELNRFFSRRWFSRVWVLQEVMLASEVLLLCDTLDKSGDADIWACLDRLPPIFRIQLTRNRGPIELLKLLDHARPTQASDPRDTIFALLGFTSDADIGSFEADYTKSVQEVYMQVAGKIACNYGMVALLVRSLYVTRESTAGLNLPLWVPDWTERLKEYDFGRDSALASILDQEPLPGPFPIQIDRNAQTISFPACEILLIGDERDELQDTIRLKVTPFRPFKMTAMERSQQPRPRLERHLAEIMWRVRDSDRTHKSQQNFKKIPFINDGQLVPPGVEEDTVQQPGHYDIPVSIYMLPPAPWGDSSARGNQFGGFSHHGLCFVPQPDGKGLLYGILDLHSIPPPQIWPKVESSREALVLMSRSIYNVEMRRCSVIGYCKRLTLASDLSLVED